MRNYCSLMAMVIVGLAIAVPASAVPAGFQAGDGVLTVRFIDIDQSNGATDSDINSTTEAEAIRAAVDAQLAPGGTGNVTVGTTTYNITANVTTTHNAVDFRGNSDRDYNADQFDYNPLRAGASIDDDFIVIVTGGVSFAPGDYSIHSDGDDGVHISLPGAGFNNEFGKLNADGDITPDTMRFETPTGDHNIGAQFTVGAEGLVTTIDGLFWERGGGDFWEIALAEGLTTAVNTTNFPNVLTHGLQGVEFNSTAFVGTVPEPTTAVLGLLGLAGLAGRRKRVA